MREIIPPNRQAQEMTTHLETKQWYAKDNCNGFATRLLQINYKIFASWYFWQSCIIHICSVSSVALLINFWAQREQPLGLQHGRSDHRQAIAEITSRNHSSRTLSSCNGISLCRRVPNNLFDDGLLFTLGSLLRVLSRNLGQRAVPSAMPPGCPQKQLKKIMVFFVLERL